MADRSPIIFLLAIIAIPITATDQCTSNQTFTIDHLSNIDSADPMKSYYSIGTSFIEAVHLNRDINADHIKTIIDYFMNNTDRSIGGAFNAVKPLLQDQVVFLILFVFGILFIVLFPLIGLIFCCCRLCGNCGGKKYQKTASTCSCTTMSAVLIICVLAFVSGIVMYCLNYPRFYKSFESVPSEIMRQSQNSMDFAMNTSNSVACSVENSYARDFGTPYGHMDEEFIDLITNVSGLGSLQQLQSKLEMLDHQFLVLDTDNQKLCNASRMLNSSIHQFLMDFQISFIGQGYSDTNITAITVELNRYCESESDQFTDENFSKTLAAQNFTGQINSTLRTVQIQAAKAQLKINDTLGPNGTAHDSFRSAIIEFKIASQRVINTVDNAVNQVNTTVIQGMRKFSSENSWLQYIGLVIMAPVALITLCLFIGLICGLCAYNNRTEPFERSCSSDCGGCFLMFASVLIFIFSWLLMAICIVIFSIGYLGQSAVCEPIFMNPNHNAMNLLPNLTLDSAGDALNFDQIIQQCKANQPIYDVFKLESFVRMDPMIKDLEKKLNEALDQINVDSVFDPASLTIKLNSTTIYQLDRFSHFLNDNTKRTVQNFNGILNPPLETDKELRELIAYLEKSKDPSAPKFVLEATKLLAETAQLNKTINMTKAHVQNTLINIDQTISIIDTGSLEQDQAPAVTRAIDSEIIALKYSIGNSSIDFLQSINTTVRMSGGCRPLYDIYENIGVVFCQYLLYPFHGFWMSLGFCLIFFIPAVICGVKLAKYFRRMDESYYKHGRLQEQARWSTSNVEMVVRRAWE